MYILHLRKKHIYVLRASPTHVKLAVVLEKKPAAILAPNLVCPTVTGGGQGCTNRQVPNGVRGRKGIHSAIAWMRQVGRKLPS